MSSEAEPFAVRDRKVTPYDRIRDAILDGTLAPGSPLVESQVAEWCAVSRTPVREALTRLEQDGLVERGERGLIVRERSPEEVLDIYEVRIVLEVTAARVAADRRTPFDLIRLERLLKACQEADPADGGALAKRNREFHQGIWVATHNDALIDLLSRLNMHLVRYPATTLQHPGRWDESLREHRELVQAIDARDVARVAELAERHFVGARDIRLTLWSEESFE